MPPIVRTATLSLLAVVGVVPSVVRLTVNSPSKSGDSKPIPIDALIFTSPSSSSPIVIESEPVPTLRSASVVPIRASIVSVTSSSFSMMASSTTGMSMVTLVEPAKMVAVAVTAAVGSAGLVAVPVSVYVKTVLVALSAV